MEKDLRSTVGLLLRRQRLASKLTLEQVEQATSMHGHRVARSTLSEIERGEGPARVDDLAAVADACGLPLEVLVAEARGQRSPDVFPAAWGPDELFAEGIRLHTAGQFRQAAWAFEEAAARGTDRPPDKIALYFLSAGHAYHWLSLRILARRRLEQALDIAPAQSEVRVQALCKMADLLSTDGCWRRALDCIDLARRTELAEPNPFVIAYLDDAETCALFEAKEYDRAAELAAAAHRQYLAIGQVGQAGRQLAVRARCLIALGRIQEALTDATTALELAEREGKRAAVIYSRLALAEALLKADDLDRAHDVAEEAAEESKRLSLPLEEERGCAILVEIAQRQGRPAVARKWKRRQARVFTSTGSEPPADRANKETP